LLIGCCGEKNNTEARGKEILCKGNNPEAGGEREGERERR